MPKPLSLDRGFASSNGMTLLECENASCNFRARTLADPFLLDNHIKTLLSLSDAPDSQPTSEDYYFDERGLMVMTAVFHQKRGYCCGNACKHCPYQHENVDEKKLAVLRRLGKLEIDD